MWWGPMQNVGPIGSVVLKFIEYKRTDRQAKYIYLYIDDTVSLNPLEFCQALESFLNIEYIKYYLLEAPGIFEK